MTTLIVDNYDSFTWNLYQLFGALGGRPRVVRNDAIGIDDVRRMAPSRVVLSPGPGRPDDPARIGVCRAILEELDVPILGVCLGHQAIGQAFGGEVVRAGQLMHGKTSQIFHDGKTIFEGLPSPFTATRYHSLVVRRETLPDCLEISAETSDGEIMGLRHKEYPVEGVQFHPESIMTEHGHTLLKNFLGRSVPSGA